MSIGPLFDRYPDSPGFKARGTSEEAAAAMKPTAATLRDECVNALKFIDLTAGPYGLTTDECAAMLGESILSIRPRFSELLDKGLIEDSGEKRLNASGRRAVVWRLRKA